MATIYRIENQNRWGLYSGDGFRVFENDSIARTNSPHPIEDAVLRDYFDRDWFGAWQAVTVPVRDWSEAGQLRFGFSSVAQARRWLPKKEWREALDQHDWVIGVYDAPDYIRGETQAIFNLATATRTGELRLTDLTRTKGESNGHQERQPEAA